MNYADYMALSGLAILVFGSMSCSTTPSNSLKSEYSMAMDSLRTSVRAKGIPREKVFYEFQLYGVSSKRMQGGVRSGSSSVWEEWQLPDGFHLAAIKYTFVGDVQITPLKDGDSFFAQGPRLMPKEKYYHEPRLEPYFDTIRLTDKRNQLVSSIERSR